MSNQNRFTNLLKAVQQQPSPEPENEAPAATTSPLDVQTSKHLAISASKAKSSSSDYKRTTFYLTQALHRRLKRASLDTEMEMSDIAETAIAAWLDKHSDV
jgi:hypothetical protein